MDNRKQWNPKNSILIMFLFLFMVLTTSGLSAGLFEVSGRVKISGTESPAPNIRIILATQVDDAEYCVFDSNLSAITNESGEFSINSVPVGKYILFFGSAGDSLISLKNAKIPTSTSKLMIAHDLKFGYKLKEPVKALKGGRMMVKDGQLVIHGYLYVKSLNLLVFSNEGRLQYVDIAGDTRGLVFDFKPKVIK